MVSILNQPKWHRVTNRRKCGICHKPDWCTWSDDGASCCMRVQSDRPMRNGGWLHRDESVTPRLKAAPVKSHDEDRKLMTIEVKSLWRSWKLGTTTDLVTQHGDELGVDPIALDAIGAVWAADRSAWAFPMFTGDGIICGIRLRSPSGDKWAVRGSRAGLFIPSVQLDGPLYIVEGPTDTAAGLTIGLNTIGRPSCIGQDRDVVTLVDRLKVREIVIVSDRDEAGQRGARRLQESLPVSSLIWTPPCKDMREYVKRGGTRKMVENQIKDMVWNRPLSK